MLYQSLASGPSCWKERRFLIRSDTHSECRSVLRMSALQTGWLRAGRYGIRRWSHFRRRLLEVYRGVKVSTSRPGKEMGVELHTSESWPGPGHSFVF